MNDRQIKVLEQAWFELYKINKFLNPHSESQIVLELEAIIEEQKEYAKRERSE